MARKPVNYFEAPDEEPQPYEEEFEDFDEEVAEEEVDPDDYSDFGQTLFRLLGTILGFFVGIVLSLVLLFFATRMGLLALLDNLVGSYLLLIIPLFILICGMIIAFGGFRISGFLMTKNNYALRSQRYEY